LTTPQADAVRRNVSKKNRRLLFRSINRHGQIQPTRLSGIDVARIVKKLAERVGLDAATFAGHSLRAGHATSSLLKKADFQPNP
jgi:integrase